MPVPDCLCQGFTLAALFCPRAARPALLAPSHQQQHPCRQQRESQAPARPVPPLPALEVEHRGGAEGRPALRARLLLEAGHALRADRVPARVQHAVAIALHADGAFHPPRLRGCASLLLSSA